jgi:DNA-binding YbaB/EbfC family protein
MQPGGEFDMQALLAQAQQMQAQLMDAQTQMASTEVTGEAGGGLVRATVKGTGELIGLTIDPKVIDPDDAETLQDLIIGAVRAANESAQEAAAQAFGPLTGGMGGSGMPGLPF